MASTSEQMVSAHLDTTLMHGVAITHVYYGSQRQQDMHTNFFLLFRHVKFISRIRREVHTCYISSFESISSVVFEL